MKKHDVSPESVMTVYSVEKPVVALMPLSEEQRGNPQEFGAVEHLRLRVLPVLGTSPAIFGQAMASFALTSLAGLPYSPEPGDRLSKNVKHRVRQKLNATEKRLHGNCEGLDLDEDDLEFIIQQTWGSRCAVSGGRMGGGALNVLTRWDPDLPPTPYNLVFVQPKYGAAIEECSTGGQGVQSFSAEVKDRIRARLLWCKDMCDQQWPPVAHLSDYQGCNEAVEATRRVSSVAPCSSDDVVISKWCLMGMKIVTVFVAWHAFRNRQLLFSRR